MTRQTQFKWGPGGVETDMCFNRGKLKVIREERENNRTPTALGTFNCPDDHPKINIPNEGNPEILYQDGNRIWVEEKLNPEQQQVLNEYVVRVKKILQIMIDNAIENEEYGEPNENNEEEEERVLAEGGLHSEKYPKFQELLRRTLVMGQSAAGDMKLMVEFSPDDLEIGKSQETMEAAFNCLVAVAILTDTEWEPLW